MSNRFDEFTETTAIQGDEYIFEPSKKLTYLFRNHECYRMYQPPSVLFKYYYQCPIFKIEKDNLAFTQFLIDCSEREDITKYREQATCRNLFKLISAGKLIGVNGHNSCHSCRFSYGGLVPQWERHVHPKH